MAPAAARQRPHASILQRFRRNEEMAAERKRLLAIEVAVEAARLAAMDDLALSRDEARRAEIEEAEAAEARKIAGGHVCQAERSAYTAH